MIPDHAKLLELHDLARKSRRPFEGDWYMNQAYVAGEQNVKWNAVAGRLIDRMTDEEEFFVTGHNICIKIARTEIAKVLKTQPVPVPLPISDSMDDMHAAEIVGAYFADLQDIWHFPRRLRNAMYWLSTTGNVFLKWYWADNDAQCAVISPFDIFPDPYARTMVDCRWMIHSQFMSMEQATALFKGAKGAKLEHLVEESSSTLHGDNEARIFSSYGDGVWTLPGVRISEYWEPPSPTNEKGAYAAYTPSGVILKGDYPYAHKRLPFTHAGGIERSTSKWHSSVIDFARPFQDELNRVETQIAENRNLANGIWFTPAEIKLSQPITGQPRQQISWEGPPDLDPQKWFVTPQGMAHWVAQEPGRIKSDAQDIVAQREVSNAGVPGRVESGQAIQLLQEIDDSVITGTIQSVEEAIAEGFLMAAFLWKQYGSSERLVRVYDKDGAVAVHTLKKDHIALNMRVRVQTTTGLPRSIAGKWDRVMLLVQNKLVEPTQALKMLDLSTEDPDLVPGGQDRRNAYAENKIMVAAADQNRGLVAAYPWDDHDIHLDELDKFRKTAEYKRAAEYNPAIAEYFAFHEDQHRKMRTERDMEMAEREAAVQQMLQPPSGEPQPPEAPGAGPQGGPVPVG